MRDVDEFLEHYGVKGMKWGVRKGLSGRIKPRVTLNFFDRIEQGWAENAPVEAYGEVYRKAQFKIRKGTRLLNADPKYVGQNFKKDSPLRKEYYNAYSTMVTDQLNAAVGRRKILNPLLRVGQSPFRRFELKFEFDMEKEARPRAFIKRADTGSGRKQERVEKAKIRKFTHADEADDYPVEVNLLFSDTGHLLDFEIPGYTETEETEHSQKDVDEFLAHWGILGMKWGVRRKVGKDGLVEGSSYTPSKQTSWMSDEELKKAVIRLNLEKQYKEMTASKTTIEKGMDIIGGILLASGKSVAQAYVTKQLKTKLGLVDIPEPKK